jgi:hypothetical protein
MLRPARALLLATLATFAPAARAQAPDDELPPGEVVEAPEQTALLRLWLQGGGVSSWAGRSGGLGFGLGAGYRWRWLTAGVGGDYLLSGAYIDATGHAFAGPAVPVSRTFRLSALALGGWHYAARSEDRVPDPGSAVLPFAGLRLAVDRAAAPDRSLTVGGFVQVARDLESKGGVLGQRWRATWIVLGVSFGLWD